MWTDKSFPSELLDSKKMNNQESLRRGKIHFVAMVKGEKQEKYWQDHIRKKEGKEDKTGLRSTEM